MKTNRQTTKLPRRPTIRGVVAAAAALGCSREHLQRVLTGQRQSRSLTARYQELKRIQASRKLRKAVRGLNVVPGAFQTLVKS